MSNDQKTGWYDPTILKEKDGYIVCKTHPAYMGIHQPKISCPGCWEVYLDKNRDTKQNAHGE